MRRLRHRRRLFLDHRSSRLPGASQSRRPSASRSELSWSCSVCPIPAARSERSLESICRCCASESFCDRSVSLPAVCDSDVPAALPTIPPMVPCSSQFSVLTWAGQRELLRGRGWRHRGRSLLQFALNVIQHIVNRRQCLLLRLRMRRTCRRLSTANLAGSHGRRSFSTTGFGKSAGPIKV